MNHILLCFSDVWPVQVTGPSLDSMIVYDAEKFFDNQEAVVLRFRYCGLAEVMAWYNESVTLIGKKSIVTVSRLTRMQRGCFQNHRIVCHLHSKATSKSFRSD
jgi:hypothetical protein